ncbi:DNA polymerase beta domain-containing protein region [Candidatus Magnetobacterium bavaricum]|uniref:DNA polymerase beta domain-containing protein region n=1 Tax=Candidatus Magnetobacterium bavaricum TaxID=29290 RepID=A0A0F3H447_9BACT|nr:DNA polymerase beta domain-containing protein region [Candidatus Magnetobacterium bavaricum]
MEQKIVDIIDRFKALLSGRVTVCEIRVFGSRARGDSTQYSDLDVLVVVDKYNPHTDNVISDCAWEAGFPDDIVIVPIVITTDDLESSPIRESSFIRNVYIEGVLV